MVTYVDDCLFFSPSSERIDSLLQELQRLHPKTGQPRFHLKVEANSQDSTNGLSLFEFLGVQLEKSSDKITLSQPGLIDKILNATGLSDCNGTRTPAFKEPLGTDKYGKR